MQPFISICIPAYKNTEFLKRLLDSIAIQTYRDYEVIIMDDSPDDEVEMIATVYKNIFPQFYYKKNTPAYGMPKNWNMTLAKAQGEWIKIMHDDDWFASHDALQQFAKEAGTSSNKFIFSAYCNVYFENGETKKMNFPLQQKKRILQQPILLMADNIMGPPSVCMVHKSVETLYDERLRWRVDIDYYISILQKEKNFTYIPQHLINVGISSEQVTKSTKNIPEVELPEAFVLLTKYGTQPFKNILVYDAWWRMFRNMHIFSEEKLREYVDKDWDKVIINMIKDISKTPKSFLNIGVLSKMFMFLSYLANKASNS